LDCSNVWKEKFDSLDFHEDNIKTFFPKASKALFRDIQKGLNGTIIEVPGKKYQRANAFNQWLKWRIHPWTNSNGSVGGIFLILEDKTNENREKELHLRAEMVSKTGSWALDLLTKELFWSPMTKKIHEVSQDFTPKLEPAIKYYKKGEHRDKITKAVTLGIKTGKPWDLELIIITANGNEVWVRAKGEAEIVNGKCVRVFGTFQDIDEKKRAELKYQEIAERLKIATNTASIGIWEFNLLENKLLWDHNMFALYGLNPADFTNNFKAWEHAIHPDDKLRCQEEFEETLRNKTDYRSEFKIVTANGSVKRIKAIAKSFQDQTGKIIKLIGANWDVTEMKNNQEKLAQSLMTFSEIFEKSAIGMALIGADKGWFKVNKSLCSILGYSQKELLSLSVDDVTYPKDMKKSNKNINEAINNHLDNYQLEKRYVHKKGHLIHALVNVTVVRNERGALSHFITQVLDITPKINAEQQLNELYRVTKAQNKSLMNFAHIVSHNLRSHASNLSMLSKFMMDEEDAHEREKLNQMLLSATESLSETIHHLNEVVRVKTLVKDNLGNINLLDSLKRIEASLKSSIVENNVMSSLKVSTKTTVLAVPAYLESILLNLYTNAIKYRMPERSPQIEVNAEVKQENVHIFFKDNGMGIDLERYGEHLFGMYKTFHKHKDAKGIGLFITKNQVEAMNGRIKVTSEVNKGTTFEIILKKGQ
jgi:PAS domain S-box-containing protein